MTHYIAFLRAINVGGRNIKMDALRQHFETLGLSNVQTFIASGNVLFETEAGDKPALAKRIESHLLETLGFEVATFLRADAELVSVARYKPFPQSALDAAAALNVAFLSEPLDEPSVQKLMTLKTDIDDFHVHGREVYWLCQKKQSDSTFSNAVLEKTVGRLATMRGINTIYKMAAKYFS